MEENKNVGMMHLLCWNDYILWRKLLTHILILLKVEENKG